MWIVDIFLIVLNIKKDFQPLFLVRKTTTICAYVHLEMPLSTQQYLYNKTTLIGINGIFMNSKLFHEKIKHKYMISQKSLSYTNCIINVKNIYDWTSKMCIF